MFLRVVTEELNNYTLTSIVLPLESSSSSVVELSVEALGSFEESFLDFTIDFAGKDVSIN